ncbi:hypothetical protein B1218_33880, partial [Pseudomonas ogarae]
GRPAKMSPAEHPGVKPDMLTFGHPTLRQHPRQGLATLPRLPPLPPAGPVLSTTPAHACPAPGEPPTPRPLPGTALVDGPRAPSLRPAPPSPSTRPTPRCPRLTPPFRFTRTRRPRTKILA